jgi:hypothetical protein
MPLKPMDRAVLKRMLRFALPQEAKISVVCNFA